MNKCIVSKIFIRRRYQNKKIQNFRIQAEKYIIGKDNRLYLKKLNKSNKIDLYKIESKVNFLLYKIHNLKGHINYKGVVSEIKESKHYWKSITFDTFNCIKECPECIKSKGGHYKLKAK